MRTGNVPLQGFRRREFRVTERAQVMRVRPRLIDLGIDRRLVVRRDMFGKFLFLEQGPADRTLCVHTSFMKIRYIRFP
jgi:hypothetical protein